MRIKDRFWLESILEAIDRIQENASVFDSAEKFNSDYRNFDASMMNLIVIGEMIDKLSSDLKNQYPSIEWNKIKSFRNIIAHDYFGVDAEEVWQIIN